MISQRWWANINRLLLHNNYCTSVAHRLWCPEKCIFDALQKGSKKHSPTGYPTGACFAVSREIDSIHKKSWSINRTASEFAHNVAHADVNLSTHPTHTLPAVFWVLIEGCPAQSTRVTQTGYRTAQSFVTRPHKSLLGFHPIVHTHAHELRPARTSVLISSNLDRLHRSGSCSHRTKNIFGRSTASCVLMRFRDFITPTHHVTTLT